MSSDGQEQPKRFSFPIKKEQWLSLLEKIGMGTVRYLLFFVMFFAVEVYAYILLDPSDLMSLAFGACWSAILASIVYALPRLAGRIVFGILYFVLGIWTVAQVGYYQVFGDKLMWITTAFFAGEGAEFLGDVLASFSALWWILSILLILGGVAVIVWFPKPMKRLYSRLFLLIPVLVGILGISTLPEVIFLRDNDIWGTRSEYAQSSSYRATYNTMYDAKNVYDMVGMYQLTYRDIWKNVIYPLTPAYRSSIQKEVQQINAHFDRRGDHSENEMTGMFEGKNVVLVLMESMDDYMITPEDTPTLYRMMEEGINFTQFYTPGYGSARTINSEFCMNTGIYLPTTGKYVFNYVTNDWKQSIASQMTENGYTSEVFHYNSPDFYSRGVFEPAMGYRTYNAYEYYTQDKNALYDDCLLFDIPELNDLFFREGPTFNTIITRSAHLSYVYNEVLSYWGLKQYPEYRGKYGSEEEDCARLKARLVDDMFARLLTELETNGQLENTVIIGMTDHYTYGYKNMEELLALSGVSDDLSILLEKTPCFVWSTDCPQMEVTKTLNTADLVPTMLNLMGFETECRYLGQDAFDPNYVGYAIFPNGDWISDGVICQVGAGGEMMVLANDNGKTLTQEYLEEMCVTANQFIHISNLLLTSDYYSTID